jgi:hypothetical protein
MMLAPVAVQSRKLRAAVSAARALTPAVRLWQLLHVAADPLEDRITATAGMPEAAGGLPKASG